MDGVVSNIFTLSKLGKSTCEKAGNEKKANNIKSVFFMVQLSVHYLSIKNKATLISYNIFSHHTDLKLISGNFA